MENIEANRLKWLKTVRLTSKPFLEIKRKQLQSLISKNAHLPDQGTDEWLAVRRFNIGGSEMSTITGDGGFSNIKRLIATKAGLTQFSGRLATRWGKMFENVTTLIMEDILEVDGKIQETSSLEGAVKYQRYSPDGVAVVKMLCGDTICGEYIERHEYLTILFEFKSPYSGIPNGKIARYYVPQVMTGLLSIPITDLAIFVNNMYRKCKLPDLNETTAYDTYFHNKDEGRAVVDAPIAIGLVLVYFKKETLAKFRENQEEETVDSDSDSDSDIESDEPEEFDYNQYVEKTDDQKLVEELLEAKTVKDFGRSSYYEFDKLMSLFDEGLVDVHYCEPLVIQENVHQIEFMQTQMTPREQDVQKEVSEYKLKIDEFAKKEHLVGYIPYKLFKSDMIVKNRDPDYLKPHEEKICDIIEKVKVIVGDDFSDLENIHARFRKEFPYKEDWIDREIDSFMDDHRNTQSCTDMMPEF